MKYIWFFRFWQKLPRSDQTPAVEVDLSSASDETAALTSSQVGHSQMVDVNLSEQRISEAVAIPVTDTTPPSSELPSYHEALRLKKIECGEIPPSYFSSVIGEDQRIPIENSEVNFFKYSKLYNITSNKIP